MRLPPRLSTWLAVRVILEALEHLPAQHLGRALDAALDARFGRERSEMMQARLIHFLATVIAEMKEDAPHA